MDCFSLESLCTVHLWRFGFFGGGELPFGGKCGVSFKVFIEKHHVSQRFHCFHVKGAVVLFSLLFWVLCVGIVGACVKALFSETGRNAVLLGSSFAVAPHSNTNVFVLFADFLRKLAIVLHGKKEPSCSRMPPTALRHATK